MKESKKLENYTYEDYLYTNKALIKPLLPINCIKQEISVDDIFEGIELAESS